MVKLDPIIAVKNVEASAKWYQQVFGFKRAHGESDRFAVLVSEQEEVMLCLHSWGDHDHPTMTNPAIAPGNGLILYFRTSDINVIRQNIEKMNAQMEEEEHINPNSLKKEFSLRDLDGYYLTITEYHEYDG